jgi:hypothetical protein
MDAAWDTRSGKRVFGLMIVEGQGGAKAVTPSDHWVSQADKQMLPQTLMDSLPHRSLEEREQIAEGFLGVTTWEKVCAELGITWPPDRNIG